MKQIFFIALLTEEESHYSFKNHSVIILYVNVKSSKMFHLTVFYIDGPEKYSLMVYLTYDQNNF